MLLKTPVKPNPYVVSAHTTLKNSIFIGTEYSHVVADTAPITITLPTPSRDVAGFVVPILNASSGAVTLSGAFSGGATSAVLEAKDSVMVTCLQTAAGTYKWSAVGVSAPLTGISETIADVVGAMVTGNTETGISVVYQDGDNTLDFALDSEVLQDTTAAMFTGGSHTGITFTYQDTTGVIDAAVSDYSEGVQDVVGAFFAGSTHYGLSYAYNDPGGTMSSYNEVAYYVKTALTGGGATALDSIDGTNLLDGDRARVVVGNAPGVIYDYVLDVDNAGVESSPSIIAPDANAGDKRWILAGAKTLSTNVTDWQEAVEDTVGTMVATTSTHYGLSATYTDGSGTLALTNSVAKYVKTSLTGGGTALDGIDGAGLTDGDTAIVVVGNNPATLYHYVLDADNAGAESSPDTISPDANAGDKRWILTSLSGNCQSYGTAANTACEGNDSRLPTAEQKTALVDYVRTGLTGGTGADLDGIDGTSLSDGDTALVLVGNNPAAWYLYVLDADNAGAESSPDIITPDANGGDKRWVLASLSGNCQTYGTAANTACEGNDSRLPVDPATWSAAAVWNAAAPADVTEVFRHWHTGSKTIRFNIRMSGADGDGQTPVSVSLPHTPADVDMLIPCCGHQKVNATWTDLQAYIDQEDGTAGNRIVKFRNAQACTDGAAYDIIVSGEYEIA